ncbi:NADH dehydrogenase [ubiquinone] iron-sulfur protein 5 [Plutella xylostella]|nr:NADH dehydrogenase [ubiquinone] iron-sulfur protein 5 [Plutella xylostella]
MAQTISPFFRSPFTDLTGGMVSHHLLGRCQRQEIRLMDCLEAHGLDRGMRECGALIDDYRECHTLRKQFQRFMAMRAERERQIAAGILTGDKKYVSPRVDSY